MKYSRVQFIERVVVSKAPRFVSINEAESLDVTTVNPADAYLIEDDGDNHVRLTKAVGGLSVRVPWTNVAGCIFAPEPVAIVVPAPEPEPEPQGFPVLPRMVATPKQKGPRPR